MKQGRPKGSTKFKKEYIDEVRVYLRKRRDKISTFVKTDGARSTSYERIIDVKLPTKEDFADYLGVSRKTLYNWAERYPKFAYALEAIHNEQLKRLINGGLSGIYNPVIAKLVLSHNHNMREKSDVTSDDESLNTFSDAQINKIASRIAKRAGSSGDTRGEESSN